MIVEGCDILLDVNQMFVRQGTLVQILPPGSKQGTRGTLLYYTGSFCLMRISLLPISLLPISLMRFFKTITLISLINVESRLLILKNSTLLKTKIPPPRLAIS